ncbi:YwmB family TATA-box binding protein [Heliobacterium chlorum]|uniref:YwmB family TATA-box binding protein n=1 Tax=Heliobacterium chlorum TaxID=2698 RepID=A0ABR7T3F0_HELCL|nr:YwmB family TATA-box binding protein [Heliobacterium chlorum]MBC9784510.1 YwmB family TATA-box binding protein [Heliobacterium chlorum]
MCKFLFQMILQTTLFIFISFFLLFRNDGAGAKWVMYRIPEVEKTIVEYRLNHIPAMVEKLESIIPWTSLPVPNSWKSESLKITDQAQEPGASYSKIDSTDPKGELSSTELKKVDPESINKIHRAMEQAHITPTDGSVTLWIPLRFPDNSPITPTVNQSVNIHGNPQKNDQKNDNEAKSSLTAPSFTRSSLKIDESRAPHSDDNNGMSQRVLHYPWNRDPLGWAGLYLLTTYKDVTNHDCTEQPNVRMEGKRLYGKLHCDEPDNAHLEMTLQLDGNEGHLTLSVNQPLPEFTTGSWFERLNKYAEKNPGFDYSVTLHGSRDGRLSPEEQEVAINACFERIQAQRVRVTNNDALLVSGYCPLLPKGIQMGEQNLNLQALARYHGVDQRTYFAIGYPLVMQEM